jgi:xanthosine phosphorylase
MPKRKTSSSSSFTPLALSDLVDQSVEIVRSRAPRNFSPRIAIILGSGMGDVAKSIENAISIPYNLLPGFAVSTVHGHAGNVVIGTLNGIDVACLQGRVHFYEGGPASAVMAPINTLKRLGCEVLLNTAAVGSLEETVGPGKVMVVNDHINFQGLNPLVGVNDERFGVRFPSLQGAYDLDLRTLLHAAAKKCKLQKMTEGVYCSCLGPSFETPAEIRMFKVLGASVVGMSLVAEIIAARHCGMRCSALSIVVNYASGMTDVEITHEETLHYTAAVAENVAKLTQEYVQMVDAHLTKQAITHQTTPKKKASTKKKSSSSSSSSSSTSMNRPTSLEQRISSRKSGSSAKKQRRR